MCISHTNKGESSFTGFGSFGGTVHETCIRTDKDKGREGLGVPNCNLQIRALFMICKDGRRPRNGVNLSTSSPPRIYIPRTNREARGLSTHEPKIGGGWISRSNNRVDESCCTAVVVDGFSIRSVISPRYAPKGMAGIGNGNFFPIGKLKIEQLSARRDTKFAELEIIG